MSRCLTAAWARLNQGEFVKLIRKRLTYANVMSSIAVFLILGGATAFAAKKISSNQIKGNSITTGKIKKEAVTASKIKKNSITTVKIKNSAITGPKVNLSTLGTVPSATNATNATNLTGQTPFFIRLGFGQSQTIAANGAVSLVAFCDQTGGNDRARILEQTSVAGAVAGGADDHSGEAGDFLQPGTPIDEREFGANTTASGLTRVASYIDQGFVLGPEGKMLTANSEGIALGINYGNSGCLFAGVVNALG
jgi:hypothetical protein